MRKPILLLILGAAIAAAAFCRDVFAQEPLESGFDYLPDAFGDSLLDVPPDIYGVRLEPQSPNPGQPVKVSAQIKNNPYMSYFKTVRANLSWTTDGGATLNDLHMSLENGSDFVWTATIPGQAAGKKVDFYLSAWDETNAGVVQLPVRPGLTKDTVASYLTKAVVDAQDDDLPASGDLLAAYYGNDGENLYYCMGLRGKYQTHIPGYGVVLQGMGFTQKDLDVWTSKSYPTVEIPFVAYVPVWNLRGVVTVNDMLSGNAKKTDVDFFMHKGRHCFKTRYKELIGDPGRGLQTYTALATTDMLLKDIRLLDATPHAILYFEGQSYQVH